MSAEVESNQQRSIQNSESSYIHTPKMCLYSPRQYLQRKPQLNNPLRKKRNTQKDFKEVFCYISPTREQRHQRTDSNSNNNPNTSIFEVKNNQNTQTSINNHDQLQSPNHGAFRKNPIKPDQLTDLKVQNDQYKQQNHQLRIKNIDLIKQLKVITTEKDKIERDLLKLEDQLRKRDSEAKHLKQLKEVLINSLDAERNHRIAKDHSIQYLEQVITGLHQTIRSYQEKSIKNEQYQKHQDYQWEMNQLRQSLKYYGIENCILKKKNLEYERQKPQTDKLKDTNKKLLFKIDELTRMKHRFLSTNSYDPIFELSPDKD